jgi:NAD-dependent SIR2 family protein deacetylase
MAAQNSDRADIIAGLDQIEIYETGIIGSLMEVHGHFRRAYCLHHQGSKHLRNVS